MDTPPPPPTMTDNYDDKPAWMKEFSYTPAETDAMIRKYVVDNRDGKILGWNDGSYTVWYPHQWRLGEPCVVRCIGSLVHVIRLTDVGGGGVVGYEEVTSWWQN